MNIRFSSKARAGGPFLLPECSLAYFAASFALSAVKRFLRQSWQRKAAKKTHPLATSEVKLQTDLCVFWLDL